MLKNIFLNFFIFCMAVTSSCASCHVSDCLDQDFVELARQYPSVGYFSSECGVVGSGTLVETGYEHLNGRVVLTCAHIFADLDGKDLLFNIGDSTCCRGKHYLHPRFEECQREDKDIYHDSFDVGIFVLDDVVRGVEFACFDFETDYTDLLESNFVSVGFGNTGHVLGNYRIVDGKKRASYAHAHACDNSNQDKEITCTIVRESGESKKISYVQEKGSILNLTPYVCSREINENNTLETFQKPSGVARSGDSGGGCFGTQNQKLIGVISGGSSDVGDLHYVLERGYFLKHQQAFEALIDGVQREYERKLCDVTLSHPERIEAFLQENVRPKMFDVIEASDIDNLIKERCENSATLPAIEGQATYKIVDQKIVSLIFHKEWIINILSELS